MPLQQTLPGAHWASAVQGPQVPATHTVLAGQSALWQHAPGVQVPPQHFSPFKHWLSTVQAPQTPPRHAWPREQSDSPQQFAPGLQPPLQHFPEPPSSSLHCESAAQVSQLWPVQAPVEHCVARQQSPSAHTPPQHFWTDEHWESEVQAVQELLESQTPEEQSLPAQQLPVTQVPLQQTLPGPHCASTEQAAQRLFAQNRPASHSESAQQAPALHAPPQQR
jgi:hypothetical protein